MSATALNCYIQSAFAIPDAAKRLQETRPFTKIPDSFMRIVVVKDDIKPWIDEQGVLTVGLLDFLTDDNILENAHPRLSSTTLTSRT